MALMMMRGEPLVTKLAVLAKYVVLPGAMAAAIHKVIYVLEFCEICFDLMGVFGVKGHLDCLGMHVCNFAEVIGKRSKGRKVIEFSENMLNMKFAPGKISYVL
ncbi:hypothetical protein CFP56_033337 [Quercus suber]|uniref:Uncharacterized protein n=1 Tax=Quercus suber TaxID=58331 RepID=A0AAW0MBH8_QUESU